jgi:DNA-binding NarL/FixJ family response regulator
MSAKAKVLIVDDHPLVRAGLAARIAAQDDLEVCGEAADVEQALALLEVTKPELMIVDLALRQGHGLTLIKKASERYSATMALVVSVYDESLFAERTLRAGARGYVNKQEAQEKVIDAIRAVLRGEVYLSAQMTQRLLNQRVAGAPKASGVESLSDRELEIFELIGRGTSTRSIARKLALSVHTIETHREHIRAKLNLRNGTELMQRAVVWLLESRS